MKEKKRKQENESENGRIINAVSGCKVNRIKLIYA